MAVSYPTYRYHATEAPVVVNDEAEDNALGKGWHDAPVSQDSPSEPSDDAPKAKKGKK